jgi:hypothetical protein
LESYKISKTTNNSSAAHKKTGGTWIHNNLEKANTFAQHLEKRFHPYPGLDTLPVLNYNDYIDKIPLEIRINLSRKRAPGFDLIAGEILENFKRKALVKLTTLINTCIRLNYIPDEWKTAEVIKIPKPLRISVKWNHIDQSHYCRSCPSCLRQ